jgi:hypothetical protein
MSRLCAEGDIKVLTAAPPVSSLSCDRRWSIGAIEIGLSGQHFVEDSLATAGGHWLSTEAAPGPPPRYTVSRRSTIGIPS